MSHTETDTESNLADSHSLQVGHEALEVAGSTLVQSVPSRKVFIRTFGCQMNEYDSQKLLKILEPEYAVVESPESADLVIINTCSVRDKPEQKLYSYIGELREIKESRPGFLIGVGGCVAQQEGENIVARARAVDFVFGTHNLSLVPSLIRRRTETDEPQVAVNYRDEWEDLPLGVPDTSRVSRFIAISRGCNKACTYCIVPTTRGKEVSRSPEEVLREVRIASKTGAKEVVLLGQTVNSYGLDLSPRMKFRELLLRVSEIEGIERIRFTSPHPQEVREDFVEMVVSNPKVCRHIHMPLQSGSDRILKLMNRNYRRDRYRNIISSLKSALPEIAITTDIIVGFPGETDEDFNDTLEMMREVQFTASYSFMFSPRPGTVAESLEREHEVPPEVKRARLYELQALQGQLTERYLSSQVGATAEILIDGPSSHRPTHLQGRTSQNVIVNLTEETPSLSPGAIIPVTITATGRHTLQGVPQAL